jgi:hypothetical protein
MHCAWLRKYLNLQHDNRILFRYIFPPAQFNELYLIRVLLGVECHLPVCNVPCPQPVNS